MDKHYLPSWARPLVAWFAKLLVFFAGRTSDAIIAATETIAESFPRTKVTIVHNYPRLRLTDSEIPGILDRPFEAVYVGGMSIARGAREMISMCSSSNFPTGWRLRVAGSTSPASLLDELSATPGWEKVDYIGQVSPSDARDMLQRGRVGLILFQRSRAHLDSLPTKMFEYLAAGIPIIASDFPRWRDIIERLDCGIVVDETDPDAVARAVATYNQDPILLQRHSANARAASAGVLNWNHEEPALLELYRSLVLPRR
ncbi:hypothetical protein GCM10009606_25860 [Nocardioides aquiterrae]|uniref:Glycosyl transferase family 1 domain-containing protein n=2 Tax=Nocardioides aquiterrae TaxID=203799 RepID=A0ABN1UE63_9ACTN